MPGDCRKEELQLVPVSSSHYMVVKWHQIHEAARSTAIRSLGGSRQTDSLPSAGSAGTDPDLDSIPPGSPGVSNTALFHQSLWTKDKRPHAGPHPQDSLIVSSQLEAKKSPGQSSCLLGDRRLPAMRTSKCHHPQSAPLKAGEPPASHRRKLLREK